MASHNQYKIQQLRMLNQQRLLEAIVILFTAIFITALLPSLLLEYLYADQVLTEAPPLLKYLPLVSFAAGILYDLYVLIGNMIRSKQIATLEKSAMETLPMMAQAKDDQELKELETLVDKALTDQSKTKRSAKKSARKRAQKK